jgi:hypothetical protein
MAMITCDQLRKEQLTRTTHTSEIIIVKIPIDPRCEESTQQTTCMHMKLVGDGKPEHECVDYSITSVSDGRGW